VKESGVNKSDPPRLRYAAVLHFGFSRKFFWDVYGDECKMNKSVIASIFLFPVLACSLGCTLAEVKVDVVSERTALENQVLGSYNSLDRDMLLAASVRGVDSQGRIGSPPRRSQEREDAVLAMQVQEFHADDVDAFKRLGWVGEGSQGFLEVFESAIGPGGPPEVPDDLAEFVDRFTEAEFKSVVEQVNRARKTIMKRVIALNDDLSEADLPEVQKIFASMNRSNAFAGEKIQEADGTWTVKQ